MADLKEQNIAALVACLVTQIPEARDYLVRRREGYVELSVSMDAHTYQTTRATYELLSYTKTEVLLIFAKDMIEFLRKGLGLKTN